VNCFVPTEIKPRCNDYVHVNVFKICLSVGDKNYNVLKTKI